MVFILFLSVCHIVFVGYLFFFFKQKTAYEMRISDWSSDVCSSDLVRDLEAAQRFYEALGLQFRRERHGNGPEHLTAPLGAAVFELYPADATTSRSEARRVGKACGSTCRSRWSTDT